MSGGWKGSDRRDRLPADWPARRAFVLKRDLYRCTQVLVDGSQCRAMANQVDHVARGDDHSYENLTSLCEDHHAAKSSREGNEARRDKKRRAYLPPDRSTLRP